MTTLEAAAPLPVAEADTAARFTGPRRIFTRLMIRGAFLQTITLGIYRFWLTTEARRFLWANTEIDGDSLDYTGTAIELLLGFLIALAILVPVYVLFFIAGLELGLYSQIAGVVAFAFLTIFGQYALYRARRYRLTRTVYRGIRFNQDGSPVVYALIVLAWVIPGLLTLGLAYPLAQASLERYKLRHTLYGDLRGHFDGSGMVLLGCGFLMWLVTVGVFLAAIAVAALGVDWATLVTDIAADRFDDLDQATAANPGFATFIVVLGGAFAWAATAAMLLFPAFQGMVQRWWLNGLRFGNITVSTRLRKRQFYGVYVRFLLLSVAVVLALALVVAVVVVALAGTVPAFADFGKPSAQLGIVAASVAFYVVVALAIWVCWQVVVKLATWRMVVDSITLIDFADIARVRASGEAASAVGEGLADALGGGGF